METSISPAAAPLVRNWIQRGLVDEVILMVCPVLVGAGKRFFENGTTTTLKEVGVAQFPRGVMAFTYVPTSKPTASPSPNTTVGSL
jgi:dihydrofolate reductase